MRRAVLTLGTMPCRFFLHRKPAVVSSLHPPHPPQNIAPSTPPLHTHRSSPSARVSWAVLTLLILVAGLAPWSGWHDTGLSPWAYLTAPVPRYVTRFDVAINVLAFVPFGAVGVLALHPRWRGPLAVLLASGAGIALSALIEGLQTYLPTRVSSNIDLLTNSVGTVLGALLTAPFSATLINHGRLARWRHQWFADDATVPLLIVALWPLAQVAPTPMLFGNGEIHELLAALADFFNVSWPLFSQERFGPAEYVLAEALVVSSGLFFAGLAAASLMHEPAPRWWLLASMLGAALLTRTMAWGAQFGPEQATVWVTPGALGGLLVGALALAVAATGSARVLGALAVISGLVLVVSVNLIPVNPFFSDWLGAWRPGRLRHLHALAQWVSTAWPYVLLLALVTRAVMSKLRRKLQH